MPKPPGDARPYRTLGRRIASARTAAGFTQRSLAEAVHISPGYIPHIEGGRARPDPDILRRIASATRADYTELAGLAGFTEVERGDVSITVDAERAATVRWFTRLSGPLQDRLRRVAGAAFDEPTEEERQRADGEDGREQRGRD